MRAFNRNIIIHILMVAGMMQISSLLAVVRPTVTFYVSPNGDDSSPGTKSRPVKTIEHGIDLARREASDSLRVVELDDGYYSIEKTIILDRNDCELAIVAKNRGKAILSGAAKIKDWRPDPENPKFLVADFPFKPERGKFYSLIGKGGARQIAAYPDKGRFRIPSSRCDDSNTRVPYDASQLPDGFGFSLVDFNSAWLEIPQEWASSRCRIAEDNKNARVLTLKNGAEMPIARFNQGFRLINARIGLVNPGSWMYDITAGKIVYLPKEGETAETLDCEISRINCIFHLANAQGVRLSGLVLEGCLHAVGDKLYDQRPLSGVISGRFTYRCVFENLEIRNTGGVGIKIVKPTGTCVRNSHLHNTANSAISFLDGGSGGNTILNNHIHHTCLESMSAGAVYIQGDRTTVMGNSIHDTPDDGITLWSFKSVIASNELYNVMQRSRDGGALYGAYDYTLVKDNRCAYRKPSAWPALYADEGSQHTVFTGNRVGGTPWPTHAHYTRFVTFSNNVFKYDKPMRWSFANSANGRFADNRIFTAKDIVSDGYLPNTDFWGNNSLFLLSGNGKYKSAGNRSLSAPKPANQPADIIAAYSSGITLDGIKGKGEYASVEKLVRDDLGRYLPGVPATSIAAASDGEYLYLWCGMLYSALTPYPGRINAGGQWGHADAVRFYFGKKSVITVYSNGTFESNNPALPIKKGDVAVKYIDWRNFGFELRVPLVRLGIGKERDWVAFNASSYNADHREFRCLYVPVDGVIASGRIQVGGR